MALLGVHTEDFMHYQQNGSTQEISHSGSLIETYLFKVDMTLYLLHILK